MKQQVKISQVKTNPNNPRIIKNDKFKKLVKSIQEFPEMLKLRPIVVDENMIVLGGNMRLKASKDAGLKEVWIEIAEGLTDEQKKEFIVKDNVGFGEWEWDMLANEWDSVQLAEWGLDVWENEDDKDPEAGLIDDDEIPEVKESKVKRGDIWQLGEHRIMCGDSTSSDDVAKLMNGEKADMVFTDPPYGMNLDADYSKLGNDKIKAGRKHKNIHSDNIEFDPTFIFNTFNYCQDILLFGADYYSDLIPNKINGSWLIWDKRVEERYDKIIGSAFEMIFSKRKIKREIIRYEYVSWANRMKDKVNGIKPHPTMKPVEMLNVLLNKFKHNLIVDLFLGSGSTLIAAEKLNRKCYGMELDEKYCDVIIERWEQFTGQKAIKNGTE
jgi:DNA modification methylase